MSEEFVLRKVVPEARLNDYLGIGFQQQVSSYLEPGEVVVQKSIPAGIKDDRSYEFRKPWLIQRSKINRPLGKYKGERLTHAADMDYMGNAHFEFGALPRSLRRVQLQFPLYQLHKIESLFAFHGDKQCILRLYANFDAPEHLAEYVGWLNDLREDKLHLEEWTYFERRHQDAAYINNQFQVPTKSDFWWDITNDVFWSYDRNFMQRLPDHLAASFNYMDAQLEEA